MSSLGTSIVTLTINVMAYISKFGYGVVFVSIGAPSSYASNYRKPFLIELLPPECTSPSHYLFCLSPFLLSRQMSYSCLIRQRGFARFAFSSNTLSPPEFSARETT
jgi:hypothetical protein